MSEPLASIIQYANGMFFAGVACYAFAVVFTPAVRKKWIFCACLLYTAVTTQVFWATESMWINLAVHLAVFLMLTSLFSGNASMKLVFATLMYMTGVLSEGAAYIGLGYIIHYAALGTEMQPEHIVPMGRTVSNIIFLPLAWANILVFRKIVHGKKRCVHLRIPVKYTVTTMLMLLGIVIVNVIFLLAAVNEMQYMTIRIGVVHMISIALISLVVWLYNATLNHLEQFEQNRNKDMMLERFEAQYQAAVDSQRAMNELRHNLNYHFLTLSGMLDEENITGAKKHISDSIGGFSMVSTGNLSIDAIVGWYRQRVRDILDMDMEAELSIPPGVKVDASIITIILGNALENAIEACGHVKPSERYIRLKAVVTDQKELLIIIKNPYSVAPVIDKSGNLATTKKDGANNGMGLLIVRDILSDDIGHIHIDYAGNVFIFTVLFYDI